MQTDVAKQPPYVLLALVGLAAAVADYTFWYNGANVPYLSSDSMNEVFISTGYVLRGYAIASFVLLAYNTIFAKKRFRAWQQRTLRILASGVALCGVGYLYACIQEYPTLMAHVKVSHMVLFLLSTTAAILFAKEISTTSNIANVEVTKLGCDKRPNRHSDRFYFHVKGGYINIKNPFQGTLINGGAGSGKTQSIAAPMIYQMVKHGWTGLVYDFKDFSLTDIVYSAYLRHPDAVNDVALKIVNFTDPSRTCRVNPLAPEYLTNAQYVEEYTATCLKGFKPEWQDPKGDPFWIEEPIALMQAVVLYFSRYLKEICDIPHIFSFVANATPEEVGKLVSRDEDCKKYAASFISTLNKKAEGQTAGVWSGITAAARKACIDPLIMWVLSGNELNLNLNHPDHPTLLCMVNDQPRQSVLSPLISLITTVCRTTMNVKKRRKSIFLLDEAPTLYLPGFDQLPNTGRENKIAVVWMEQNLSQMRDKMGKEKSENILGSLSNVFWGNCTEMNTVKYVSEFFGKEERIVQNTSTSASHSDSGKNVNDSISFNVSEKNILRTQDVGEFAAGEFAGKIIGRKPTAFYRAQFRRWQDVHHMGESDFAVPPFSYASLDEADEILPVSDADLSRNKARIERNVAQIKNTLI
jgi:hypothetical protein